MVGQSITGTEVPIIGSCSVKWLEVSIPASDASSPPDGGAISPSTSALPAKDAASCSVIGNPPTYLTWRIHKSLSSALELLEICADKEFPRAGLRIHFPEALFPFVSICQNEIGDASRYPYLLYGLSISGVAYLIRLKNISSYASCSGFSTHEVLQCDLRNYPSHSPITASTAVAGQLVIGREDGSIASYRIGLLDQNDPGFMQDLRDEAGFGRLWGFMSRGKIAGSVVALRMAHFDDRKMVFALHADGTLKIWDLFGAAKIFSLNVPGTHFAHFWVGEVYGDASVIPVAIICKEALVSSETICVCKLNFLRGDKITFSLDYLPLSEGVVLDVRLASNKIWILKEGRLIVRDLQDLYSNMEEDCYALQEAFVAEQLFQTSEHSLEYLFQVACSIFSTEKAQTLQFLSSIFLRKLLHPGVHNSRALHNVFEEYGKHWSDAEFQALTVDGLRKEILLLIEHEAISGSPFSVFKCWRDFCSRYYQCWCKSNASYGLLVDSLSGAAGVIRKNSVSLFRNLEKIEMLSYGSSVTLDDFSKLGLEISNDLDGEILVEVLRCSRKLSERLGGAVSPILYESLVSNPSVSFDDIVPILFKMIESGCSSSVAALQVSAVGADMVRQKQMEEKKNLRRFSVDMLLSLRSLYSKTNGWRKIFQLIQRYVQILIPFTMEHTTSDMSFSIAASVVVPAASQVAKAMFESALDILMFLRYLLNISGQIHMVQQEITESQLEVIPMIYEIFMDWLAAYFLCTTPSEPGAVEDFNSQLSSLRIDGGIGKVSWTQKLGSFGFTLGFVLLMNARGSIDSQTSQSLSSLPGPENFINLVQHFTSWMMYGGPGENFSSIFEHSVDFASILLKHGQYKAAETILLITDAHLGKEKALGSSQNARDKWCLLHHLLGCCLVAQAHYEPLGVLRERKISQAVRCLFRAPSGGGVVDALEKLPREAGFPHLGGSESAASWKLKYFQWAMQLFEQYNMSQAACQFALAALEQVDEALVPNILPAQDVSVDESRTAVKGRLWANVFKFVLDRNEFSDAYCAMVSNPDEESKKICLRRLIIVLYECGAAKIPCNGQLPFIGLTEKAERELAWKAARSDIAAKANPFKLLYAFEMHQQNWRKAASYMYLYSAQLNTEGAKRSYPNSSLVIQERLNAISAAINALRLLHPAHAWVDLQIDGSRFHNDFHLSKRARTSAHQSPSDEVHPPRYSSYVSVEKLEDEFVLASAEHLLSLANVKCSHTGNQTPPTDLVDLLVQADLYDMAFTVLLRFSKGSELERVLERVFSSLSLKCCPDKSISPVIGSNCLLLTSSKVEDLATEIIDLNTSRRSKSSNRWEVLELYLEKYRKFHARLPVVVAETLLRSDSQIELPLWLVHIFKGGHKGANWGMADQESDPAALLCLYVDYGRYTEATDLLIEYLEAYRSVRPEDLVRRKSPFAAWFPYATIERLWFQLEASIRAGYMAEQGEKLKTLIRGALQGHLYMVEGDSEDALSSIS